MFRRVVIVVVMVFFFLFMSIIEDIEEFVGRFLRRIIMMYFLFINNVFLISYEILYLKK